MKDQDTAARTEILARLALSREELRRVLDPPRQEPHANGSSASGASIGGFPRSRTMQMLMSERGLGILGAAAAGLLLARPALALRLLRIRQDDGDPRVYRNARKKRLNRALGRLSPK
jgi:hypothetical protein